MSSSEFLTRPTVRGICRPEDRTNLNKTNTEGLKESDEASATLFLP